MEHNTSLTVLKHGWNLPTDSRAPGFTIEKNKNEIIFTAKFLEDPDFDTTSEINTYTPDLWQRSCGEFFLMLSDGRYFEFNVTQAGLVWWQVMKGIRNADPEFEPSKVLCEVSVLSQNIVKATLNLSCLPLPETPRGNICFIHSTEGERRYFSYAPLPGETPDFHQPDAWPLLPLSS